MPRWPGANGRFALAVALAALVVFWANACFVWNHFYVRGGFLYDAGWLSDVSYRRGFSPPNRLLEAGEQSFFALHPSLIVAFSSGLVSRVLPLSRIEYFCFFQGAIYASLMIAPALLIPPEARKSIARLAFAFACLLAFAFSGQILACVAYPHFEILAASGISLMLAGMATGRRRFMWLGVLLACGTREDGGFHAALFAGAVLASDLLGRPFRVSRRDVAIVMITCIFASGIAISIQRFVYDSPGLFQSQYSGVPFYGHLTKDLLLYRASFFREHNGFVYAPFLATLGIAVVRRDARVMLGYAASLPWFLLNVLAFSVHKAELGLYIGFPFVASAFFVAPYLHVTGTKRALVPLASAAASFASLLGLYSSNARIVKSIAFEMSHPLPTNAAATREFANALRRDPSAYGNVLFDQSVASLALESITPDLLIRDDRDYALPTRDGLVLFTETFSKHDVFQIMMQGGFTHCGSIPSTTIFMCRREGSELPPIFRESSYMMASLLRVEDLPMRAIDSGYAIEKASPPRLAVFGPFVPVPAGNYRAKWLVTFHACDPGTAPVMLIDILGNGELLATKGIASEHDAVLLDFEATKKLDSLELRTWTGRCAFDLHDIVLEKR